MKKEIKVVTPKPMTRYEYQDQDQENIIPKS